ncbi:hypothetical protein LSH36_3g30085 [Paralvinella palmiformis]|uniref:Uncharacterized protein n=1 Tax=Paralvinella palmiformis TaxID=53620 RepID=A0AAD9NKF9_9ANNE|nr:hypothetical protein LSH36_3g30085 [Paralvinella palmiformis]
MSSRRRRQQHQIQECSTSHDANNVDTNVRVPDIQLENNSQRAPQSSGPLHNLATNVDNDSSTSNEDNTHPRYL